jgi:arylsulfatase A-like enzyme
MKQFSSIFTPFRFIFIFIWIFTSLVFTPGKAQETKPNFIVILADDLGYADVGVYGATEIRTPNIDILAQGGTRFTSFYSNSAVCCPTRAAFLTGRYSNRVGIDNVITLTGPPSTNGIKDSEVTLAEVLKTLGYTTTLVGKWHLGHLPEYNPTLHGFDSFFGLAYSNNYNEGKVPLYRNTEIIEQETDQTLLTHRFTQEALDFIDLNKTRPFFLYLAYTAPHVPLYAHPDFVGKSQGGLYGDVVEELDWGVGQVMDKIQSLGLSDNTLIVFSSDNGPWIYQGENGGSAGPFYCGKGSYFEGGIRVPFITRWPGRIPAGRVLDNYGAFFDLYPTIINLAGGTIPPDKVIDGNDITGMLLGNGGRSDDDIVFTFNSKNRAIRAGRWKFHPPYSGGYIWADECGSAAHPELLYDIINDPGETTNLASQKPAVVSFLKGELSAFRQSLGQPNNQPPLANFTTRVSPTNPKLITFDASNSSDKEGNLKNYNWNFGDGKTGSGKIINHTYTNTGTYIITLKVKDAGNLTDGIITDITLGSPSSTPTPTSTTSPTTTPSTTPEPIVNMLKNPGFEEGTTGWGGISGATTIDPSVFHGGVKSLKEPAASSDRIVTQSVIVSGGVQYRVSSWIKTQGISNQARISVQFKDSANNLISTFFVGGSLVGDNNWSFRTADLTTPTNAVSAQLRLVVRNGSGTAWFDDTSFASR